MINHEFYLGYRVERGKRRTSRGERRGKTGPAPGLQIQKGGNRMIKRKRDVVPDLGPRGPFPFIDSFTVPLPL